MSDEQRTLRVITRVHEAMFPDGVIIKRELEFQEAINLLRTRQFESHVNDKREAAWIRARMGIDVTPKVAYGFPDHLTTPPGDFLIITLATRFDDIEDMLDWEKMPAEKQADEIGFSCTLMHSVAPKRTLGIDLEDQLNLAVRSSVKEMKAAVMAIRTETLCRLKKLIEGREASDGDTATPEEWLNVLDEDAYDEFKAYAWTGEAK